MKTIAWHSLDDKSKKRHGEPQVTFCFRPAMTARAPRVLSLKDEQANKGEGS